MIFFTATAETHWQPSSYWAALEGWGGLGWPILDGMDQRQLSKKRATDKRTWEYCCHFLYVQRSAGFFSILSQGYEG